MQGDNNNNSNNKATMIFKSVMSRSLSDENFEDNNDAPTHLTNE